MIIGILGGTGPQGRGLARRFVAATNRVILGSRSADRAELAIKIVVDCVNPLGFDAQGPFSSRVAACSAAQEAAAVLPDSTVIGAFHHVSAVHLDDPDVHRIEGDVPVLGEHREAVATVCELATTIPGARGIFAGRLRNAGQVESFTANRIAINRRDKAHAGLTITDVA